MDAVFGRKMFRNEMVMFYSSCKKKNGVTS